MLKFYPKDNVLKFVVSSLPVLSINFDDSFWSFIQSNI